MGLDNCSVVEMALLSISVEGLRFFLVNFVLLLVIKFSYSCRLTWCNLSNFMLRLFYWQDLGDYADSYYAVQTLEGEQIAQLISGYIDIILKKVQSVL
jgi:hypothetical protein